MRGSLHVVIIAVVLCGVPTRAADGDGDVPADEPAGVETADGTTSVVVPETEAAEPLAPEAPPDPAPPPSPSAPPFEPSPPPDAPRTPVAPPMREPAVEPPHDGAPPPEGSAAPLLDAALEPPAAATTANAPAQRPLMLLEALQRPGDPSRRLWIAQAYWKTSAACGWVRWAADAVERLELVAPGSDPHDRAVLDVATAAARADLAEARSQLGLAQQELIDLARLPFQDPPPWPVDRPLTIPYQTHFDAIFATRIATGRTRAIARTLPARHEALEARAAAATAAMKAMAMAEADHAQGRRPIEAVVAAHAMLVGQQREFLAAVRAYNLDIAEYAMAVADVSIPDDRFVVMLIGAPSTAQPPATLPPPGTPPAFGGTLPVGP